MTINTGWDLVIFLLLWALLTGIGMAIGVPILLLLVAGRGDVILSFLAGLAGGASVMYLHLHNRRPS